ncbi:bifunctional diguanylate cyclase/phosphodiesterase [Vibrio agarivorans]|uniref:bifunctional diguanylate cyclase/phosphodiesterase n=1 Tax=Vibrio agarivorans TaxID=153622 RepID=UPI00222F04BC|nr:EAL domain-containing protein [Vibrio agarivorans]
MTLYKQLVAGMISVFMLLLVSVAIIELRTTRNNLEQQQRSEVYNTINTVGLALAPYLEDDDTVAVESVINALFDGSTYSVVRLIFLESGEEILRSYPVKPSTVPNWFVSLDLFDKIHEQRVITSGWMQLAEVEIISHPGEAYQQLWQAFQRILVAFFIVMILGLAAIAFILKRALSPLKQIVSKMEQVANNHFGSPLPLPVTKDLQYVVNGINKMSSQVEESFKSQVKEAQRLREQAYIDPVSQLGNRKMFMTQLNSWLDEGGLGGVALLEASFIQSIYDQKGYQEGDEMVRSVAKQLANSINEPNCTIARLSSVEIAFIFPNIDESELKLLADSIINYVQSVNPDPTATAALPLALGVISNDSKQSSSDILAQLDNAVATAKGNPEELYHLATQESAGGVMGKQQWKALVEEAIHNDWFDFRFQAANNSWGQTFHREIFTAIVKGDERYTANQYLFALEQLKSSNIFDEYVIEAVIKKLELGEFKEPIAINISPSSVEEASFIRWISYKLGKHKLVASLLHFELPERCFVQTPHYAALFCNAVKAAGAHFGVDNYGRNFQALEYLSEFSPSYVKLDYLFTHNLDDEKQKYTLTSISRTAHNLGITTIASRVETQTQLDFLSEHFVDAFQGFIVDNS